MTDRLTTDTKTSSLKAAILDFWDIATIRKTGPQAGPSPIMSVKRKINGEKKKEGKERRQEIGPLLLGKPLRFFDISANKGQNGATFHNETNRQT